MINRAMCRLRRQRPPGRLLTTSSISVAGNMQYFNSVNVNFGWGVWEQLLSHYVGGRKTLLLTYPQAEVTGLFTNLRSVLGDEACMRWLIACPEQPDLNEVRGLYRRVKNLVGNRDVVLVAVGGGSVIDLAKILSLSKSEVDFHEVFESRVQLGKPIDGLNHVPVIAVPTTAGAGSEVTPWATIWDRQRKNKYSVRGQSLWPEVAIVDPTLALTCPAIVTRNAALDSLSHALEALWNVHHNPVSDCLAIAAARGILKNLPFVLEAREKEIPDNDLAVRKAREELSAASLRAGMAFSNTETALAHALSFPITAEKDIKHGLACSFSLPHVLQLAMGHDAGRDQALQQVFEDLPGGPASQDPQALSHYLEQFLRNLGVSTDPADYGLADKREFESRLIEAAEHPRGRNFIVGSPDRLLESLTH